MALSAKTETAMNDMVEWVNQGKEVYAPFFSYAYGAATTAAAIRAALKRGLIEQKGIDGCGNPKYGAPAPVNTNSPWYVA